MAGIRTGLNYFPMALIPNKKARFKLKMALRALKASTLAPALTLRREREQPVDILLCLVDHFEPHVGKPSDDVARARMDDWMKSYPEIARKQRDADGRHPAHGFF